MTSRTNIHVLGRFKPAAAKPDCFLQIGENGTVGYRWVRSIREATRFSYEDVHRWHRRFDGLLPPGYRTMGFIPPLREDDER